MRYRELEELALDSNHVSLGDLRHQYLPSLVLRHLTTPLGRSYLWY